MPHRMSAAPRRRAHPGAAHACLVALALIVAACTGTPEPTWEPPYEPPPAIPASGIVPDAPTLVEAWTTLGSTVHGVTLVGHVRVSVPDADGWLDVLGELDTAPFPDQSPPDLTRLRGRTLALARPGASDVVMVTYPFGRPPGYALWSPGEDPRPLTPPAGWPAQPDGMLRSPDGTRIAAVHGDVVLWNTASGAVRTVPVHSRDGWTGGMVRWLDDGHLLLARDQAVTAGKAGAFHARYQILDIATGTIADATPDGPLGAEALETRDVLASATDGGWSSDAGRTDGAAWLESIGAVHATWLTHDALYVAASRPQSSAWSLYRLPVTPSGASAGVPEHLGTAPPGALPASGAIADSIVTVGDRVWAYVCSQGTDGRCELADLSAGTSYRTPPDGIVTHLSRLVPPGP